MERCTYPESTSYAARYILSKPRVDLYGSLVLGRYCSPVLDGLHTPHGGESGYWSSPQRSQVSGRAWQNPRRHFLVVPGNTGFSDLHSTNVASSCSMHHTLVWKYRWLSLKERVRTYRPTVAAKTLYRP